MVLWDTPNTKQYISMEWCLTNVSFVALREIEGAKHIYIVSARHSYHYLSSIVMVLWYMREYEMVPVNGIMLKKGQFMVKIESEKHIYIIPAKHSYHYLSSIQSIVMVLWDILCTKCHQSMA